MNVKLFSYRLAIKKLEKEIDKLERQKARISEQLFAMTDENSTVRARANKRSRLEQIGEDVRFKQSYISELQRLIDEKEWRK